MKYENQNDDLILSDYSRMMKDPEIESKEDGQFKALILNFTLPSSSYATMLLREILKSDTSAESQIKMQNEINVKVSNNQLKRPADESKESVEGNDKDNENEDVTKKIKLDNE
jgi:tRNA pseudouridine13 synthase